MNYYGTKTIYRPLNYHYNSFNNFHFVTVNKKYYLPNLIYKKKKSKSENESERQSKTKKHTNKSSRKEQIKKFNRGRSMNSFVRGLMEKTKNKSTHHIPISKLKSHLYIKFWKKGLSHALSPADVISNPKKSLGHESHYHRIKKANLDYPIIIRKTKSGKMKIVDGFHRLAKAYYLNHQETIKAKFI